MQTRRRVKAVAFTNRKAGTSAPALLAAIVDGGSGFARITPPLRVGKHIVCIYAPPVGVSHNKQLVGGTAPAQCCQLKKNN